MLTVDRLAQILDEMIPKEYSEPWDNDGRMVIPDGSAPVQSVTVALDATTEAIKAAAAEGSNVIVTHHPLVFEPMKSVDTADAVGRRVAMCIRNGIAVLSYHTRLDSMPGGVNDCLAEAIGLAEAEPFLPFGRIGSLGRAVPFAAFADDISDRLGEKPMFAVARGSDVRRIALVSGGGKGFVRAAYDAGADTYLTGEASHAAFIEAAELGMNMICMTHHATERVVLPALCDMIGDTGAQVALFDFDRENEYGI